MAKKRSNKTADTKTTSPKSTPSQREPNEDRAIALVMRMMAIPGASGNEVEVAEFIIDQLRSAGAAASAISTDRAHRHSPITGNTGNLIFKLAGTRRTLRRMFSAHLDTVPICVGCKPVRKGNRVHSADPATGLGGDDRAGAAVVLNTALEMLEHDLPRGPLTFLWPVQEEVGLQGAHHVQISKLGLPKLAFNFDGGSPYKLTVGATGGYRIHIEITGLASHAGGAPQDGISAIAIASLAIADLHQHGWHGLIRKSGGEGTSNIGVFQGGVATNVVPDKVEIKAEARSHDRKFRKQIVSEIESAFRRAVKTVKNAAGKRGKVSFDGRLDYESFKLPHDEPSVVAAAEAVRAIGQRPQYAVANGGLDANWLTAHGIATVSLGCGQLNIHTVSEQLDLDGFTDACRIAMRMAVAP